MARWHKVRGEYSFAADLIDDELYATKGRMVPQDVRAAILDGFDHPHTRFQITIDFACTGYNIPAVTGGRPGDWAEAEYEDDRVAVGVMVEEIPFSGESLLLSQDLVRSMNDAFAGEIYSVKVQGVEAIQ